MENIVNNGGNDIEENSKNSPDNFIRFAQFSILGLDIVDYPNCAYRADQPYKISHNRSCLGIKSKKLLKSQLPVNHIVNQDLPLQDFHILIHLLGVDHFLGLL